MNYKKYKSALRRTVVASGAAAYCITLIQLSTAQAQGAAPLPEIEQILGKSWQQEWQLPAPSKAADYSMANEAQIGHKVLLPGLRGLTFRTEKSYGPGTEIRARFQLAAPESKVASFTLSTAIAGPKEAGYAFSLTAANNDAQLAAARVLTGGTAPAVYRYQVKAYPIVNPTWDSLLRASIERDMAALPSADQRWFDLKNSVGTSASPLLYR